MARARDYREHLDEVLKNDAEAVAYLNAALAEEDPEVFLLALRDVACTREGGLAGLAERAQLDREHLYRMLSENGNPELRSLEALLDAPGFRLSVETKATGRSRDGAQHGVSVSRSVPVPIAAVSPPAYGFSPTLGCVAIPVWHSGG